MAFGRTAFIDALPDAPVTEADHSLQYVAQATLARLHAFTFSLHVQLH